MSKIWIQTLEVAGFAPAILGMRNPMNSWDRADSQMELQGDENYNATDVLMTDFKLGDADRTLACKLVKAGAEHCKFLRQIQVWTQMDMPRYWWSEFDTYKFNTKNSCSTMHKLFTNKYVMLEQFFYSEKDEKYMAGVVTKLNEIRRDYLSFKKMGFEDEMNELLARGKQLLPESFIQKRTVNTNYAELMNAYHQRRNHRLKYEWVDIFCSWCESLPYFYELCIEPHEKGVE